jgi:hypothetical protein
MTTFDLSEMQRREGRLSWRWDRYSGIPARSRNRELSLWASFWRGSVTEMKRWMLERTIGPEIKNKAPWHKPDVLQWINSLARVTELCVVKY